MYMIVGLGNPEKEYQNTRHSVGRDLVFKFADTIDNNLNWKKDKYSNALRTHAEIDGVAVELVIPETYMNKSGESVAHVLKKQNLKPEHVIVVYDDLDLPLGKFKISHGRGSGGHNGIESIITGIGSKEFTRIRVGISPVSIFGNMKKPKGEHVSRFVLGRFSGREERKVATLFSNVHKSIIAVVTKGVAVAMNTFN